MSEVKRFDFDVTGCQVEDPLGGYVDHDDYAKLAAEAQALREEVAALRRDKARLDAIEDNCWDVRHGSSSNADAGDSSIDIEIVGYYQGAPHIRVLGESYTENLRAAIDQAMTAEAYPPERPEYDDHGRPLRALLSEQEGGNDVSNHQ
ncbi:hypothetical protein N0609_05690 [Pseudomonas aeruginosa]|nr:hypothetical protein [Pseudomonas aeruginosa]MCT0599107.1 hypothetical protein [Pseudomonas aeruginosa]